MTQVKCHNIQTSAEDSWSNRGGRAAGAANQKLPETYSAARDAALARGTATRNDASLLPGERHGRRSARIPCGLRPWLGILAAMVAGEGAYGDVLWDRLEVSGPQSKLLFASDLQPDGRAAWQLRAGAGLWYHSGSRLADTPHFELRLGRRIEGRRPLDVDIYVSHARTRIRPGFRHEEEIEYDVPPGDGEPVDTWPVHDFPGRRRHTGRLWHFGISAAPVMYGAGTEPVALEVAVRGSVFGTWADFRHDSGWGSGVMAALVGRMVVHRRFAVDAAVGVQYAHYAVAGAGGTLSRTAVVGGTWFF